MPYVRIRPSVVVAVLLSCLAFPAQASSASRAFEANGGQLPEHVRYGWRGSGMAAHFSGAKFEVLLGRRVVDFRFVRGNAHSELAACDPRLERRNFLSGGRRTTNVPTFGRVQYRSVYPGIDAVFHSTSGPLELDFVVAPDADPSLIALQVNDRIELHRDGSLRIGPLRMRKPVAFQESAKGRTPVEVRYAIRRRQVRLIAGTYDRTRPLIIDPVLDWATYFGGSVGDSIQAVTTDAGGNIYIAGLTNSPDLPMSSGFAGIVDGFVSKLTPAGDAVLFTTYLGGSSFDAVAAVAIDGSGIYVTGSTQSPNFPVTPGAFDEELNDDDPGDRRRFDDMFVAKLALDGSQLLYSTYLGGTSHDGGGQALLVDQGFAYVSGRTSSPDFPTAGGASDTTFNGVEDVFVVKVAADGSHMVYSTFLGGNSREFVFSGGLALDPGGTLFVAGATQSFDFPLTAGTPPLSRDLFVAQFDADGALLYCTAFGGSDNEGGNNTVIALDGNGGVLIAGETGSPDWPVAGPSAPFGGGISDVVVARLEPSTSAFIFSRLIGGAGDEGLRHGALGDDGFFYITGETKSPDFPLTPDALDPVILGSDPEDPNDGFLVRVDAATGAIDYSSFFGGAEFDTGVALAYAGNQSVLVAADTVSTDLPVTPGALDPTPRRSFLARFSFAGAAGDGVVGIAGGTVTDGAATGASFSIAPGVLAGDVTVTIEALPDPGPAPPPGFSAFGSQFVSFVLTPNPSPIASPGATITLPLDEPLAEGTVLDLFKYDSGSFADTGIDGTVDAGGATATFAGVTGFSTFVALRRAYRFTGFLPPLANDGPNVFQGGRAVPVKFRLALEDGSPVTDATATLRLFALPDHSELAPESAGSANPGAHFRCDPAANTYIYNLKTSGLAPGSYLLQAIVDDGSTHGVTFTLR